MAFKITIFCSSLLETGMPYTTYITEVDNSFNNNSLDLAEPFYGKNVRVIETERESNTQNSKGVQPVDLAGDKFFDSF